MLSTAISQSLFLAALLMLAWRLPALRIGLNLADEGYLYFGTRECLRGRTPIRDFRAYDPGRYLWCAFWQRLFGRSLVVQRLAMHLVTLGGLTLAGTMIQLAGGNWALLVVALSLLTIWAQPYFKAFEIFSSLLTAAVGMLLLLRPDTNTFMLAGAMGGMMFFVGLNLGLYGTASLIVCGGLAIYLHDLSAPKAMYASAGGSLMGMSPWFLLLWRRPRLGRAYVARKIQPVFDRGTANLPLPWPLIGRAAPQLHCFPAARRVSLKLLFTLLPVYYLGILLFGFWLFPSQREAAALLMASGITGFFYLHHLFSRADFSHLCQSIHPALLTTPPLVTGLAGPELAPLVLVAAVPISLWLAQGKPFQPWELWWRGSDFETVTIGASRLKIPRTQATLLKTLHKLIAALTQPGEPVFAAPIMPGLAPLLDRQAACYDVFPVYPATDDQQRAMIAELDCSQTGLAIIQDIALDGRDDLRFANTHPLVWHYLQTEFALLRTDLPTDYSIFRRGEPPSTQGAAAVIGA